MSDKTQRYANLLQTSIDPAATQGEQDNARSIMGKMREKDPDIHARAMKIVFESRQPQGPQGTGQAPPPGGPESSSGQFGAMLGGLLKSFIKPAAKAFVSPYRQAIIEHLTGEWTSLQDIYEEAARSLDIYEDAAAFDTALFVAAGNELVREGVIEARPMKTGMMLRRRMPHYEGDEP